MPSSALGAGSKLANFFGAYIPVVFRPDYTDNQSLPARNIYYTGFRALRLMPCVPNFMALDGSGTSSKILCLCATTASSKPASVTAFISTASSRPPAIHPVHKDISSRADSGTARDTRMSPI